MTSTLTNHSSNCMNGGNNKSSSSVIIIRSEGTSVQSHEDEDSNLFDDPDSSILRCHIMSHHQHLMSSSSHAVKKDVNLSSTSCIEVIKRERINGHNNSSHSVSGQTSTIHNQNGHPMLGVRSSSDSSLLHPTTLDRYCESPSFLLDTSSSPTPHLSSLSGHHSHHHLGGTSDDDVDVDETSNDGRVSGMSTETVHDPDLMFSCSALVDPREVTVVTPSIMVDSVMGDDDHGVIPTTSSILTSNSSPLKYALNGHRDKNGHANHSLSLHGNQNSMSVDDLDAVDDEEMGLSLSIKQEKMEGDVSCILKHPPLNHLKSTPVSSSIVISSNTPVSLGAVKTSYSKAATIHSPLILSQLNSNNTRLSNGTLITHQNHSSLSVSKAIPDSSTSSMTGITVTTASTSAVATNGHQVSSTTGCLADKQVVISSPSIGHQVLTTSNGHNTVSPVVASTLPSTISLTTNHTSMAAAPLDIKILPAGILQLASNLAAVFPPTASNGSSVQKQQIAIQLLREDGTSIILPITTRGTLAMSPISASNAQQGIQQTTLTSIGRTNPGLTIKSETTVTASAGVSKSKSEY